MKSQSSSSSLCVALVSAAIGAATLLGSTSAFAQDTAPEPLPQPQIIYANPNASAQAPAPASSASSAESAEATAGPPRYDLIRVNAGVRIGYVTDRGFDSFASNDVLPQFSVDATYPLLTRNKLVLGVGLGWDAGGRSDTVRGLTSSMGLHRFSVPIEGRYHILPGLYGFGKIAPGTTFVSTTIKDNATPDDLTSSAWAFSADASVGASILMGPRANMDKRGVRFWITPEFGYSFMTKANVDVNPNRSPDFALGTDENTSQQKLALSGFFWRASIGTTF